MAKPDIELRNAPPLLLAAGLLLWGWQTEFILYALIMATMLESAIWTKWQWQINDKDFNQIADLSSLIFFAVIVYVFVTLSTQGIFTILKLLPFLFFLLVLVQVYSERGKIRLSTFFVSLRRLEANEMFDEVTDIDMTLPYFFICMVSASAGNQYPIIFFLIICLLTGWILWTVRPRRYHPIQWIVTLCLAFALAYLSQTGIKQLQTIVETTFLELFDQFAWRSRDPYRTTTAIGSVGRLKLSDRIMLRIKTDSKLNTPMLLREATYNSYGYGIWSNQDIAFFVIDQDPISKAWVFNNRENTAGKITIGTYLDDEKGIIPVPHEANAIATAAATQIEYNPFGSVRIESRVGWINYAVTFNKSMIHDSKPDGDDLEIPPAYKDDFKRLVSELELNSKTDEEIIRITERFFKDNFYYSLVQNQRYPKGKFLSKFLFETKKGHCEYFATATALLLRAAGIPTRYAVGYSVQEYSPWQDRYIARARHAHSWVLYYINDRWQTLDTTPATWAPLEAEDSSPFQPIMDIWSWLKYRFSGDPVDDMEEDSSTAFLWLLIPLIAYLGWRLYFKRRIDKTGTDEKQYAGNYLKLGMDSDFFRVIQELEKEGNLRRKGETLNAWINRIQAKRPQDKLIQALTLHYRYRFDPGGRKGSDRLELDRMVQSILS